jgi:tetratricopeptide (TPR) repeat protein
LLLLLLLQEVAESRDDQSQTKKALEVRNMTCLKLLSGMYRDVVSTYDASYEHNDGLALMVVASAYFAMGRFDTALAIYQKAGAKLREKLSTDPECIVHCAKLFNNMGVVYYEMKKYEKAMQTFQRALQLFHDENEDNYSYWVSAIMDQASIMNNMAYTLIKFKLYDDASDLVDASFELQQLLPGNFSMTANSIMTVSTLSSMAFIYQRTKKYKPALDTYTACAQLQAKSPIHGDNDKVDILKKMVGITKKVKNHEKRVQLLRCILLYQQTYCTEEDEEIWETNKQLGEALQCLAEMDGVSV